MKKCIAVVAYNRSDYFLKCLHSIHNNGSDIDKFIFIDGGDDSIYEKTDKSFFARVQMLGYVIHAQKSNLGIAHHKFYIRDYLTSLGYDYFIIVEEDVVVSKNFIDVTCNLAEWAFTNYDDVGVVTTWNMCKESPEWKEQHLNDVEVSNCNWITYAMHARCWKAIRPYIKEYMDRFIVEGQYALRPHGKIREWYIDVFGTPPPAMDGRLFPEVPGNFWPYGHISSGRWPSSQDGCMVGALGQERLRKIATIVNRCMYIGKEGQHGRTAQFYNAGFGDVHLHEFPEEREIKTFEPRS